jgi:disulfide bond formation protein DsbB
MSLLHRFTPRQIAWVVLLAAAATIGGALVFEHVFGLRPCKLCLVQRNPYYLALPLAAAAVLTPPRWTRILLALLGVIFLVSAGLGAYHAGVEWGFFVGPNDCGGTPAPTAGSVQDFLKQLETARVVSCIEAAWRFLGLSLAGWNVVISLGLAGLALASLPRRPTGSAYGSSSLSQ